MTKNKKSNYEEFPLPRKILFVIIYVLITIQLFAFMYAFVVFEGWDLFSAILLLGFISVNGISFTWMFEQLEKK